MSVTDRPPTRRTLEDLVGDATRRIVRRSPHAACSAAAHGAVIIDIRAQDARQRLGIIPGSVHVPRTVLEWRVAPESPWRNRYLGGLEQQLILVCDHGYSSILAAATLVALGFEDAGDVIGGFEAWAAQGLPVVPCPPGPGAGALPGSGPAD